MVDIEDFKEERECIYKNEHYSVRDNGAILRYPVPENRPRPKDNIWSFGKLNSKTGYLEIASIRVHRIVATAFHGEPPTKEHVVDHIDTNKQNNRPDNLRWVTRLENVILNPITARRIELVCGSVEAFLANPFQFRDKFQEPNFEWMCTVSAGEAQISLQRMLDWAKSSKQSQGGSLEDWIYSREVAPAQTVKEPNYMMSKTPNAAQRIITYSDKPNEFPCTPQAFEGNPLIAYSRILIEGIPFFRNHNGEYTVLKVGLSTDKLTLYVLTKAAYVWREREAEEFVPVPVSELAEEVSNNELPRALTAVTYEDGLFVHEKMELGFHPTEELEKMFTEYLDIGL